MKRKSIVVVLAVLALVVLGVSQACAEFWVGKGAVAYRYNNDGTLTGITASDSRIGTVQGLAYRGGNIYAFDYGAGVTLRFNVSTGAVDSSWSITDSVNKPLDITVGPDGKFYLVVVTVGWGRQVARYNADGSFDTMFVPKGTNGVNEAAYVKFGPDGKLYVGAGPAERSITRWNADGTFDTVFANCGAAGMDNPTGFTFDSLGRVYVADFTNGKAPVRFNADGSYDMTLADVGYAEHAMDWIGGKLASNPVEGIRVWDEATNAWANLPTSTMVWTQGFAAEPVPEPSSLLAVFSGLGALAFIGRRR